MCTTDVYTYVYPDGRKETATRPSLCPHSRHGKPCVNNVVFQHASQSVPYSLPVPAANFSGASSFPSPYLNHFPPTPSYTPQTSTPVNRSGDESDRSYKSGSSGRRRRSSGLYINGQKLELNRHRDRRERIVLVDNPPTPLTPPQAFTFPQTAPSSPSLGNTTPYIVDASPRSSGPSSRRPVIVDERSRTNRDRDPARIRIEFVDEPRKDKHARQSSTSSYGSRGSFTNSASEDDAHRKRRLEREQLRAEKRRQEQENQIRQERLRTRISQANAEIANRPAVPIAAAPLKRSSTSYASKSTKDREHELLDAIRKLDIKEKKREMSRAEEEEAQRWRLMQRTMPRRRASVGPGVRRHRVLYDDGVYRWE